MNLSEMAAEMGRKGGKAGGKARIDRLTATEHARLVKMMGVASGIVRREKAILRAKMAGKVWEPSKPRKSVKKGKPDKSLAIIKNK